MMTMCFSLHVEKKLSRIAEVFDALSSKKDFASFGELKKKHPEVYMAPDEDSRIYPNYWAPIVVQERGHRIIKPMRYRIRPAGSQEEVPAKFNLFNARLDALESRKTWRPLLAKRHCLIPIRGFYEWVKNEGLKKQIEFFAPEHELMGVAGLYDLWQGENAFGEKIVLPSFAVITNDPPREVEEMGHDRCPIVLRHECWDEWLQTKTPISFLEDHSKYKELIFENQFI